ncbi:anthranilate phosphoribosyltransferase [Polyangium jinanense]|uniref:Anthranilate phosphoribosyltransferase n=1 Tax=Polyangium jinanense TaxID=2829994 RepID=A0A9X3XDT1_9BACT|nr:anthranilate phosphoribosyltransferase [Polyangium jinanense]MDC3961816.1 anthranilate phosphoribosyltransferase [Polyangium jinanense]MDC3988544.1 anthranilate phosphoribosyltransferase [Polyangium jinanense]
MSADVACFAHVFEQIAREKRALPRAIVRGAFDAILAGAWTPVQVAGFVVALRLRGEDASTIAAAAEAMRAVMVRVDHGLPAVLDTCGTGGDGLGTLNVSTAAALVCAATGAPVAKHGNRSVSSRSGSADVLEALGVPIDVPPERQAEVLREAHIAFLFAPAHHPAMRHGAPVRRELAIRTIFNALGPLSNPACTTHQLLGTYDHALRPIFAATLAELGVRRAWVVRGEDGLDEVSPFGPTRVTELARGSLREMVVRPENFGLPVSPPGAIQGGSAAENAEAILAVLRGEPHPARCAIVLNAAAALAIFRETDDPRDWPDLAAEAAAALDSGAAMRRLASLRDAALRVREPEAA